VSQYPLKKGKATPVLSPWYQFYQQVESKWWASVIFLGRVTLFKRSSTHSQPTLRNDFRPSIRWRILAYSIPQLVILF
jgi:hypothetical protein